MKRKRKTKAEKRQEESAAEYREWEKFRPRLESAQSYRDVIQLLSESPRQESPGGKYYSNLRFLFQGGGIVPAGSTYEEKSLYLQLIRRLDAAGELMSGVGTVIERELLEAMAKQEPWRSLPAP